MTPGPNNMIGEAFGVHLHQYKYLHAACTKRETIDNAWAKLRKGKTKRPEVILIESNYDFYADLMSETLKNTRPDLDPELGFRPKILPSKKVFEHGKERTIYCPPIWDQWVHHIIVQVLAPIIVGTSYEFSCGSMPNRGGIYGKRRLERMIKRVGFRYVAKLDIRHFFSKIRLEIVIKELRTFVCDEWFIHLIRVVFSQFKRGLPLGFYISQWLANFVLSRLDWVIKRDHSVIAFIRYADDYVICGNNKKKLHTLIGRIAKNLGKLRLKLKGNWQVFKFEYKPKDSTKPIGRLIDFMGYKFGRHKTILRKLIMLRGSRLARHLGKRQNISVREAQSMLSRIGWFKHTNTKVLFINHIIPFISIRKLKHIVSKDSKRRYEHEQLVTRISEFSSTGVPAGKREYLYSAA